MSGLVLPAGMGELAQLDGSPMFEPPEVTAAKKMAAERAARALQLERRRIADGYIPTMIGAGALPKTGVIAALEWADELIAKTGGGI